MSRFENIMHSDLIPRRACELFTLYSRFEYALKCSKFFKTKNGKIAVEWQDFANKRLGTPFFKNIQNSNIAPTIFQKAPRKRISNKENEPDWQDKGVPEDVQSLIAAVTRIRANLFHGDKQNVQRDNKLVNEAIEVLKMALQTDNEISAHFFENDQGKKAVAAE